MIETLGFVSMFACALGLLLSCRLVFRPSDNPPASWSLAFFLICVSAFVADEFAYPLGWFERFPHAYAVANPFIVAIFPSLFLYVKSVTHPTSRWKHANWLHATPSFLVALSEIPTYLMSADAKRAEAVAQYSSVYAPPDDMIYLGFLNCYGLTYLVVSWKIARSGRDRLLQNLEEGRNQSFRGLESFVALLLALTAVSAILDFSPWRFPGGLAVAIASTVGAFTAFWYITDHSSLVAHKGIRSSDGNSTTHAFIPRTEVSHDLPQSDESQRSMEQPDPIPPPLPNLLQPAADVPTSPEPSPKEIPLADEQPTKKSSPPIVRPEEFEKIRKRLKILLEDEKAYCDASISLQILAERTNSTRHKMSFALKEIYDLPFYQLIAKLRVVEASRIFQTKNGRKRTISDVAFGVGFNSLSAFNNAFKAEFGSTASVFREKIEKMEKLSKA